MRLLIATGGTGGHVYPAIALADAAKKRYSDIEILFVGNDDRMEASEVPAHESFGIDGECVSQSIENYR